MYGGNSPLKLRGWRPSTRTGSQRRDAGVPRMPHLHLPADHTDADIVLAVNLAEIVGSEDLYVAWSHESGPGAIPEIEAVLVHERPLNPLSEFFAALAAGFAGCGARSSAARAATPSRRRHRLTQRGARPPSTTTPPSTSTPPASWTGVSTSPNTKNASDDRRQRLAGRQDRRRRRADAPQPGEEQADRARRSTRPRGTRARASPRPSRRRGGAGRAPPTRPSA